MIENLHEMVYGETRLLFRNDASTPLGRLTAAGLIRNSSGVGPEPRRLGSYAIVYILEGSGRYWDTRMREVAVRAGDLILIFPEIEHCYGPGEGEYWNEFYLIFDGPVFDLSRQAGLLDPGEPIIHLEPIERWLNRMEAIIASPRIPTLAGRIQEVSHFLALLSDICSAGAAAALAAPAPEWLTQACQLLEARLEEQIEPTSVAKELGLSYETFRKHFQHYMGVSPARYRATRRIDAACTLLQDRRRTTASIAQQLGFSDEFHFSRRFKQITGVSPREFRRRLPN